MPLPKSLLRVTRNSRTSQETVMPIAATKSRGKIFLIVYASKNSKPAAWGGLEFGSSSDVFEVDGDGEG